MLGAVVWGRRLEAGGWMTRARKMILDILSEAEVPLSAAEIHRRLQIAIDLATVYRSLHFLEDATEAESFSFTCAERGTERYFFRRKDPHVHFFHCERCHRFLNLGECRIEGLIHEIAESRGLTITAHTLYFTGFCAECGQDRSS